MYDYYLFPLPRASKWNRPIFDHSEVKIDLYLLHVMTVCFTNKVASIQLLFEMTYKKLLKIFINL